MWMPFESLISFHFTRPAKDHFLQLQIDTPDTVSLYSSIHEIKF